MSDYWGTPAWIRALFIGWYDPCPPFGHLGREPDDLKGVWEWKSVFVNPPYSKPLPWVEKAIRTAKNGSTVVMLMKHDSSTQWYRMLKEAGARSLMIEGRLNFENLSGDPNGGHNCSFPSVLMVLGGE